MNERARALIIGAFLCHLALTESAAADRTAVVVVGVHDAEQARLFASTEIECVVYGGSAPRYSGKPGDAETLRSVTALLSQLADPSYALLGTGCEKSQLAVRWVVDAAQGWLFMPSGNTVTHVASDPELSTHITLSERIEYLADRVHTRGKIDGAIIPCSAVAGCKPYHRLWFASRYRKAAQGFREIVAGTNATSTTVSQEDDYLFAALDSYATRTAKTVPKFGQCSHSTVEYRGGVEGAEWFLHCDESEVPLERVTRVVKLKTSPLCEAWIETIDNDATRIGGAFWAVLDGATPTFQFVPGHGCKGPNDALGPIDAAITTEVVDADALQLAENPDSKGSPVEVTDVSHLKESIWLTRTTTFDGQTPKRVVFTVDDAYGYPYRVNFEGTLRDMQCKDRHTSRMTCEFKRASGVLQVIVEVPFRLSPGSSRTCTP